MPPCPCPAYECTVEQRTGQIGDTGEAAEGADGGDADGSGRSPAETRERRFEILATVLLGLAALATAWSGYQASLWDGIQSSDYSQASALRVEANRSFTEANQLRLADLTLFENYIDATLTGEPQVAEFYRSRFRDEFEPAFEAWQASDQTALDAPTGPFAMDEYQLAAEQEGNELEDRAHAMFEDGEAANDYSDTYVATTLFFASALFFAAISERFSVLPARVALLIMSGVGLVVGLGITVTQPVTSG
jgi:hypothetical protein